MQPDEELRQILDGVRDQVRGYASDDPDKWWYANRFVFARLQLDERKTKTGIKRDLLDAGGPCHSCGEPFDTRRDAHLHRLDGGKGYRCGNCVLMHGECHRAWHAEHQEGDSEEIASDASVNQVRKSKRYNDMPFLYWWDITPAQAESLDRSGDVEFVKKDTGERCVVPADVLLQYLVPERQSTRAAQSWGVKVLKDHEDELSFEPGTGGGEWVFLPVVWIDENAED